MINKVRMATIGALSVALLVPTAVFAQEDTPERHARGFRASGEITGVVPGQGTFTLMTRKGDELEFQTNESTKYRSPNGSVEDIHDLEKGMKALVMAQRLDDGTLMALMVAAGLPEDLPDHIRMAGQIVAVDPESKSFALQPREGEPIPFQTGERTRYRGEGIEDFDDLKVGMHAMVAAIPQDGASPLALVVAVGQPKDRPDLRKFGGEITGVVPGRGTFTLLTRDGEELLFSTNERTKFRSHDGSVKDIHDLKKGMHAFVGAVQQGDGSLVAAVVAVGNSQDRPPLDARAAGQVVAKGENSFTLQTREGEQIAFSVNANTKYKGIGSFAELKVGMVAGVGAQETDDGLAALVVAARNPEDRPQRSPEDRPDRRPDPSSEPTQEVSI